MHDRRNFGLVLFLATGLGWTVVAWIFLGENAPALVFQRTASLLLLLGSAAWLVHALLFEDKLPDHLRERFGDLYYDVDGVSFMPIVRVVDGHAELCIFYQNRHENPAAAVIHLRPRGDCFVIHEGWRDVHFAFRAGGGDFGVIHQPIHVPERLRGEVIEMLMAAASHYPRSQGARLRRLRRGSGLACGDLLVDWTGAAFKSGVHEVSGDIELIRPVIVHLPMPRSVQGDEAPTTWRQQVVKQGG